MSILSVHHNFTYVFKVAQGLWLEFHSVYLTLKVIIFLGCCPTNTFHGIRKWNGRMKGKEAGRKGGRGGGKEGEMEMGKWKKEKKL